MHITHEVGRAIADRMMEAEVHIAEAFCAQTSLWRGTLIAVSDIGCRYRTHLDPLCWRNSLGLLQHFDKLRTTGGPRAEGLKGSRF